jgi:hypothetical protein
MGFISLWVCVSENICMKVCLIVCLVLYILSYVLCYFIMGVCQWDHLYESLPDCVSCPVYIVIHIMSFHYGCVSVTPSVWKFAWLCVLSCIYCHTSYVISLWVCVSGNICMKVCMIVCLVLYILSYVLCYFIMSVCQWQHLYESLHDCVSCPVYIAIRLMLFHYGCVSVTASVWKFAWLCVLSCIYCHTSYVISLWVCVSESICYGCVSVKAYVWKFVWVCVLSCIYCHTSYFISLWVCVNGNICMKVCMIVCLVLYILSYVLCYFIMSVCQWQHLYESLHDCVSCPVYIVIRLMLFHYGCVSVTASVWKFAWLCVLSCIYCHTSYVISLWVCVSDSICMKVCMIVCLVLYILSYILFYFIMLKAYSQCYYVYFVYVEESYL